jgi:hypothetical protein
MALSAAAAARGGRPSTLAVGAVATLALLALGSVRSLGAATAWPAAPSAASASATAADTLARGHRLRDRWHARRDARQRELGYASVADAPRWSFATETYMWDWYPPYWPCLDRERVGRAGDGGKWMCGMEALAGARECVVYSYGVRDQASWEAELVDRTRCVVYAHDPSVKGLPKHAQGRPALRFERLGLNETGSPGFETLLTTMRRRGHAWLDVLKLDIERTELCTVPVMLAELAAATAGGGGVPFGQLLLEIHHNEREPDRTHALFDALERAGLVPFSSEVNHVPCLNKEVPKVFEYSFVALRTAALAL